MGRWVPPVRTACTAHAVAAAVAAGFSGMTGARQALPEWLRARFGCLDALLVDSGTSALMLALSSGKGARDSPVALPAYGCFDLATAALGANAGVVLYDVEPDTLAPETESLDRVLATGVRAVVLVHLFGIPLPFADLRARVEASGATVVEDAAQGTGASLGGRALGGLGAVGILSFGRGKGFGGAGGGALLANDTDSAEWLGSLPPLAAGPRAIGAAAGLAIQSVFGTSVLYGIPASLPFLRLGETIFRPPHPPTAIAAAAVAAAWAGADPAIAEAQVRRERAARLVRDTEKVGIRTPRVPGGAVPGYLRLPIVCSAQRRAHAEGRATRRLGIMPGYPCALTDLPGFGDRVLNRRDRFPGARELAARLVTLPTHGGLTDRDLWRVEAWLAA